MSDDDTWRGRLIELSHVIADPFLRNLDEQYSTNDKLLLSLLEGITETATEQLFKDVIIKSMEKSMYKPEVPREELKRRSDIDLISNKQKLQKTTSSDNDIPPIPSSATASSIQDQTVNAPLSSKSYQKQTAVESLKSQRQVSIEELEQFRNKSLNSLEIISVPEHYPIKPQTVSSLAELYYLTQTLPLIKLLPGSHKVLMTENFESALLEGKIAVLYSRIEELKRQGKWSLRQPQKFNDPLKHTKKNRRKSFYWDSLIKEAKWMSEDFKEGTKYKKYCCILMAEAVEEYWKLGKELTCVKRKEITFLPENNLNDDDDTIIPDSTETADPPTINTELLQQPVTELESLEKSFKVKEPISRPNSKMSSTPFKSFVNIEDMKKIDQSIVKNLPKFTAFDDENTTTSQPLQPKECPITAVSRLVYPFESDEHWYKIVLKDFDSDINSEQGPPGFQKGLFGSHRRFNYLKPPKPPLIKNIDYRSPTIWLPQDDKRLIHYVAEYCFNWDLIAEHLSPSSTAASVKKYESNIERRTPWQCFERYIQLNEKFQFSDMKGVYAYHAQQWLEQAHRAQSTTKRRISPLGVGAESIQRGHRRLRWASLFDAMRKVMKKREIASAKINHRKSTADYQQSQPLPDGAKRNNVERIATPAELSKLKFERDKSIHEAHMNQQATRSRMMAAVAQQQTSQRNSATAVPQPSSSSASPHPPPPPPPTASASVQNQVPIPPKPLTNISATGPRQQTHPLPPQPHSQIMSNSHHSPQNQHPSLQRSSSSQMSSPQPTSQLPMPKNQGSSSNNQVPVKRPTTPNGTPLTNEQIQQLINIQKQRRMLQAQAQAQAQQKQQHQQQHQPQQHQQHQQQHQPQQHQQHQQQHQPQQHQQQHQQQQQQQQYQQQQQSNTLNQKPHQIRDNTNSPNQINLQPSKPINQNYSLTQPSQQVQQSNSQPQARPRFNFPQAQVSAIIHTIQQQNPTFTREQVTKLAAQYLAGMQQQQQQRILQQRQNSTPQGQNPLSQSQNQISNQMQNHKNQTQGQARLSPQQVQQIQSRNNVNNAPTMPGSNANSPNMNSRQQMIQQQMTALSQEERQMQIMQSGPSSPTSLTRQISNQSGSPISGSPNIAYANNDMLQNSEENE